MDAPSIGSTTEIALRQFTGAGRPYEGGDLFDPKRAERDGLTPHHIEMLRRQRFIGPLTRDTYYIGIGRRPPGSVGAGFDPAELLALGIIDEIPPAPAPSTVVTGSAPSGEAVEHRGCRVVPYKQGSFTRYEALDAEGRAMRAKRFTKVEGAIAFIDQVLGAVAASPEAPDAAPGQGDGAKEEAGDGDDVRSGTGG